MNDNGNAERKNSGKLRWRNFPLFLFEPVIEVGASAERHAGNPEGKYDTWNFLKGMKVEAAMDSLKRHLMQAESPFHSEMDPESKCHHLAHVAWNALVALHNIKNHPEMDDRYRTQISKNQEVVHKDQKLEQQSTLLTASEYGRYLADKFRKDHR